MGINNGDGEFEVHANINTNVTVGGRTQARNCNMKAPHSFSFLTASGLSIHF